MDPDATNCSMHDDVQQGMRLAGGSTPCLTNISSPSDCWCCRKHLKTSALDTGANDLQASDRLAAQVLMYHSDGVIYEVRLILHVQGCQLRCIHQTSHQLPVAELPHIYSMQDEGVLSG